MEVVASGMAVVSLSIQLIESVGTIKTFIRNVKEAPKELYRLVGLLERLRALLEDVRSVTERQTTLQEQYFPAPSATVLKCLQSCERSLQPLQDQVERYKKSQEQATSRTAMLKSSFKFSLKTQDIACFETKIQREIDHLHAALELNSTAISMNIFPMLLQNQQKLISMLSEPARQMTATETSVNLTTYSDSSLSSLRQTSYISREAIDVRSALQRLGVSRRKLLTFINYQQNQAGRPNISHRKDVISEEDELGWFSTLLGYGFTWTLRRSYGTIAPSISVYPVVNDFDDSTFDLMVGDIQDIQKKFSSGALHPRMQTSYGFSLLHIAAGFHRPDVCQMLLNYGVKPSLTATGLSPLYWSMAFFPTHAFGTKDPIGTYRCLLEHMDISFTNFQAASLTLEEPGMPVLYGFEEAYWLWNQVENRFPDEDIEEFRRVLLRGICAFLSVKRCALTVEDCKIVSRGHSLNCGIVKDIQSGQCNLLLSLFGQMHCAYSSYVCGAAFIDFLLQLGVDVEKSVTKELEQLPGGVIATSWGPGREILFEGDDKLGWTLGFKWSFKEQNPGSLVLSEYDILACENFGELWPYLERDLSLPHEEYKRNKSKRKSRYERRMANKVRKENKRTGLNRPRSKMPGSWD